MKCLGEMFEEIESLPFWCYIIPAYSSSSALPVLGLLLEWAAPSHTIVGNEGLAMLSSLSLYLFRWW